jgi:hypothetical protein
MVVPAIELAAVVLEIAKDDEGAVMEGVALVSV